MKRLAWLSSVHSRAEALLSARGFADCVERLHRPDQKGKRGLDGMHGYYWYLHALILVAQPRTVVELGQCLGTSTLFLLAALPENGRLITVDTEERASELSHCLDDPRLTVIVGNDLDLSIYDGLDLGPIDFLFVDTDHRYEQAKKESDLYLPLLSPNALVVFDDTTMNDMGPFWDELSCAKIETGDRYHYTGFGLVAPDGC